MFVNDFVAPVSFQVAAGVGFVSSPAVVAVYEMWMQQYK